MQFEDILSTREMDGDLSLRPESLSDFIGQKDIVRNLEVFLTAARLRSEPLDHILFSGPPGLGKTSLARIISKVQGGGFYQVSGSNLKRPGDIARLLTGLSKGDVLFIDEIHSMPSPVEEILYPAMEDNQIDITIGEGNAATVMNLDIPPFTLVGATTRPGALSNPLADRFGIKLRLEYYPPDELSEILRRASTLWNIEIEQGALMSIAVRARMTPRVALRLLRRIWDFAIYGEHKGEQKGTVISEETASRAFDLLSIDEHGLTKLDRDFISVVARHYDGGPVGLKPLSAVLSEDTVTLEDYVEPFLVRTGFVVRTPRGRMLTQSGWELSGVKRSENTFFRESI